MASGDKSSAAGAAGDTKQQQQQQQQQPPVEFKRALGNPFALQAVRAALDAKQREVRLRDMDDGALTALAADLASPSTAIVSLCLGGSRFGRAALESLAKALTVNFSLRILQLDKCGLDDADLRALMLGVKANRSLRALNLDGNRFTEQTAEDLAAVFKEHASLLSVSAQDCGLTPWLGRQLETLTARRKPEALAACALPFASLCPVVYRQPCSHHPDCLLLL